jgi:pyoverdine/dityrosine biosynthesis protein Dit1
MANHKSLDVDMVLAVFRRFSHVEELKQPHERSGYDAAVTSKIQLSHASGNPIPLLLPAAPFKNSCPNKVLDTKSPDFGEELGLSRLNHLCDELAKVYLYGAELTIVSDGPVYNGKLSFIGSITFLLTPIC